MFRNGGQSFEDRNYDPKLSGQPLDESHLDGYVDTSYSISFQGVRTADVNSGQWMTPDCFDG